MNIHEASKACLDQCIKEEYFLHILNEVLKRYGMFGANLYNFTEEDLVAMWNEFWEELPDDKSIRTGPFFLICDLCTGEV